MAFDDSVAASSVDGDVFATPATGAAAADDAKGQNMMLYKEAKVKLLIRYHRVGTKDGGIEYFNSFARSFQIIFLFLRQDIPHVLAFTLPADKL